VTGTAFLAFRRGIIDFKPIGVFKPIDVFKRIDD
jgi:hypothetical protein